MKRAVTLLLAGTVVLPLAACQAPVHMFNMIVPAEAPIGSSAGKELSVEVGSVEGGKSSGLLNDIRISDLDLREAIINSLAVRGALARGSPDFRIDAEVIRGSTGMQEILMGLNVTTTVDMRWLVTDPASGDRVFSGTLTSAGTASSSEYFNPTERIQVATERAIQENIRKLIATLYSLKR